MKSNSRRTILIVDDVEDDRILLRRLLKEAPRQYTVLEATTGREGIEFCREAGIDCILLDFFLPDMNGVHFLDALRKLGGGALPLPLMMLSGVEDDEAAAEALKRGAQDYLVKEGLSAPVLRRAVENTIEKFRIQHELVQSRLAVELRNHKLAVLRDQLQEKVNELAEATKAKDQFMAVMSHEMRTPLNAIIGYADLLEMEMDGSLTTEQREKIERIQVGSRHLLDLINDVLDLARADANKLNVDIRPVDIGAVLEEVGALLESDAEARGLSLDIQLPPNGFPNVRADLNRLRQILTNLIGNAIKFTEEGGVQVVPVAKNGSVTIEVRDTGIGIDAEVLPLIFSEFYQARGELTRERGGSGLGLAISQRLAALMGGSIDAESEVGSGSVFRLTLPAADAGSELRTEDMSGMSARREMRAAQADRAVRAQRPVVVIAYGDQEDALRELERQVQPGVDLLWTTRPDEVSELAKQSEAALVVLDIGCADGAGWRVAHTVQESPHLAQTAILLLPCLPDVKADASSGGLNLGWLSLVPKPFTADQLTSAVSTAAGRDEGEKIEKAENRLQVLVVDDDPDSRRVAAKFLSGANLEVREAADGETGLVEMHRDPPDVVVLDLMMPVLDGFGVLATMRADPELSTIPVVVLTAKSLTDAERRFLGRTAVRVLQKGEHRLADVATLVMRAAARSR